VRLVIYCGVSTLIGATDVEDQALESGGVASFLPPLLPT